MEVGRVCMRGGLGKCYLPFLSLINVKNNGALVARQPHSTWFWFTARGEGTACSKLVPPGKPPPSLTTSRRLLSPKCPSPHPQVSHVKIESKQKHFSRICPMSWPGCVSVLFSQEITWKSQRPFVGGLSFAQANYSSHFSIHLKEAATYSRVKSNHFLLSHKFFYAKTPTIHNCVKAVVSEQQKRTYIYIKMSQIITLMSHLFVFPQT